MQTAANRNGFTNRAVTFCLRSLFPMVDVAFKLAIFNLLKVDIEFKFVFVAYVLKSFKLLLL